MELGQQKVQPSIPLGRTWSNLPEDLYQRDRLQIPYGNHQRLKYHQTVKTSGEEGNQNKGELTRSTPNQLSSTFTPFRNQQISGQESPLFTIPGSFQEKTRIQGQKKDLFQQTSERVKPNYLEAFSIGERHTQEPEIAGYTSRISSPINRNINPTQTENNVVTPESNLKSDELWLKMSQFAVQTQNQLTGLQESHERMKTSTASMEKIVKTLQEGHAQLSKASEETNKRLNQVFEEQHHSKRDRDCPNQEINKFFNVHQNMKHQPEGHALENP
ncbi:hypothetical protein O181_071133 [Austropuccinia psidii MF-1]|uniref:Uncharacterized protein n=1 Tax=Austropuccinia psidii MF-1 TaxID=1389203 RepID=A0A9Q3F531_9BASI|nr:hypothetical protein [Austropuccinia psidii MF-1]